MSDTSNSLVRVTPSPSRPAVRRAWVPAALWLAVIAWESTPLGGSQYTGHWLRPIVLFFAPHITAAQFELLHELTRKAGHWAGYGILSLLMLRAWWATLALPRSATHLPSWKTMLRSWNARAAVFALASTVLTAGLDEWHQSFIPGRTGALGDVVLDTLAAACVQLLLIAFSHLRRGAMGD